ncbi:MAG TPA: 4Fe-4S binding protein [Candidatus Omnitrophota bacterium]|nr:4Fe-4S binding protein [Candidatus Omnitrophota bacterium]HPS19752.1 4Fe-4S binding protein [Candidatus Omnitrophota bacterium]
MKRKIIKIDETKCNGCGQCIPNCPEGALRIIDGKAKLREDALCDGLGACIGRCPLGAITIEEREAEAYDESKVMENVIRADRVNEHLEHLKANGENGYLEQAVRFLDGKKNPGHVHPGVCPGARMMDIRRENGDSVSCGGEDVASTLEQWPIQLHLLNPAAPYFKNADIVVAADCVPFAYAGFHQRFLKGKKLIIFCPKLDDGQDVYIEKMAEIFRANDIKTVTVVHMVVPCCRGTESLVEEAIRRSGENVILKEYMISLEGNIV